MLDAGTLLLEYSLGETRSFLWAVTPDSINTFELPKRSVIEPLAQTSLRVADCAQSKRREKTLEERRGRLEQADAELPKAAASLSRMLLGPVAAELKNKRLLIVADGVLQFVPFAGVAGSG